MLPDKNGTPRWFVLNHIAPHSFGRNMAAKAVERFNNGENLLELFAPTFVKPITKDGKTILSERPLTYHYVFVRGTEPDIMALCAGNNGFSLLLSRAGAERYATVSDSAMHAFKTIARAYSNRLPFFRITEADLEEGDEVEVIDGPFAGLQGVFMPRAGARSGNIVVSAGLEHASAIFNVKASSVRVLRFACNSTRLYDQVDAFIPKLFRALRLFQAGETLPTDSLTSLTVFCQRMESLNPDNRKFGAKLAALLACANTILGRAPQLEQARNMLVRNLSSVTNPLTLALIHLLDAIPSTSASAFRQGLSLLGQPDSKQSKSALMLRAEYAYYSTRPPFNGL